MPRLRLRIGERLPSGEIKVRIGELYDHPDYRLRLVQSLIDRAVNSLKTTRPEALQLLLADRTKFIVTPEELARAETIAVMDQDRAAPPPQADGDMGEGSEVIE